MLTTEQNRAYVVAAAFIFLSLMAFGKVETTDGSPVNSSVSDQEELPWDISTDNVAAYSVLSTFDLESLVKGQSGTLSSRRKRATKMNNPVFKPVTSSDIRKLPYHAAVHISAQCSGILISESHVLTAAHCLHDGKKFLIKPSKLRIGLPRASGHFAWKKVSSQVYIPRAWRRCKYRKSCSLDTDFAVLKMRHLHGQKYLTPKASRDRVSSTIKFNAYPGLKGGELWHSSCAVETHSKGKLLISRCFVSKGSSGAGVYESLGFGEYAVTGVVSAILKFPRRGKFAITNKLTPAKVKKICRWVGRKDC
ncbi:serine protease 23-like [Dendronephthya gigantea]|uniref:serine protease 23-like n=1 Tax=Dendronephthya gigantea TaxID=151771 RepID=UPI00106B474D|nr:serine protease 23-like [Dendronephthya gigantea]XP_028396107.1 serine protease 23-like [Dendronephthya gigantea]XP_028396183.1 serine protease 23-like [Dendronephthya gigantea]XP_028396254.1 serine protease 23-like [Dendronephthya gigantea]